MPSLARLGPLFIGSLLLLAGLPAAAEEKHPVTPEDIVAIREALAPVVSPDGSRVAFVVREPADPRKPDPPRNSDIWVVPADGSEPARPFAASPKTETRPRWSPDGRYLAFLSDRGTPAEGEEEATPQIYLLRTDGGEAVALTAVAGEVEEFHWSPDGKSVAFVATDPVPEAERKKKKQKDDAVHVDHDYQFARLWVVGLDDRKPRQVFRQEGQVVDFEWAPDGSELAVAVAPTPRLDDVYWWQKLVVVRLLDGEVVRTLSDRLNGSPRWSPDGKTVAFFEFPPQRIGARLAVVDAAGGSPRVLLDDYAGTLSDLAWMPDSQQLVAGSTETTRAKLLRIDVASGGVTRLADLYADGVNLSVSRDGGTIAYLSESPDAPPDVWCLRTGREPRQLTRLNPQVGSLLLGRQREIQWQNKKDGKTIYGLLFTPPDFQAGRRYPTVVQIHGGPEWVWWQGWYGSWHEWAQLLASHGYVVLLPNPRGSDGQGWRFAAANVEDWGGMDLVDILDGVDQLVAQGIADPDRLGIGGWSYGGFMTSWTVTQTHRFKAAVVGAAVTDLFSFHGTTDITPTFLKDYFRGLPYGRDEVYRKHSAMSFVQNVKTPCLVLHGEADRRVPVTQGWELYSALKQLGVATEMVTYPREEHPIHERAHQADLLARVLDWFDRYLKK
jgi:dipeptidyl aminopeptidase/acylaminoacyl peptidase